MIYDTGNRLFAWLELENTFLRLGALITSRKADHSSLKSRKLSG